MEPDLKKRIDKLERDFTDLNNEMYKSNFSGQQDFPKYSNFTSHLRIPVYDTKPATCDVGEICSNNGQVYVCTAGNVWVATATGSLAGFVSGPTTNSADYIPQWDGVNSKTLKNGLAVPSGGLAGISDIPVKATQAEVSTGTDDAKFATALAVAPYANQSLYRQAIINGNFDVWQRGTSLSLVDTTAQFQADRWYDYNDKGGGTLPTLTRSRQLLTSGDITGAYYYTRLTTDGAGTSLGVSSQGAMAQKIENGTRNLCGLNKRLTVSFYAKSDIADKRICPVMYQFYGTGGSPSSPEYIKGTPITLTSSWVKYTATFDTNTLAGKTFGTANDDFIQLALYYMWGTTLGNIAIQTGVTAETYVGAGTIDIAQVQLCAGSVALPFQPKSFAEELRDCQRYCYVKTSVAATTTNGMGLGWATSTTSARIMIPFPTKMRIAPTATVTAADWQLADGVNAAVDVSSLASTGADPVITPDTGWLIAGVDSGLTQYRTYYLRGDDGADRLMIFSAEL
jgi:hypothetical protein